MYNHNKAQQSKNRVHISWDILYSRAFSMIHSIPIQVKKKEDDPLLYHGLMKAG